MDIGQKLALPDKPYDCDGIDQFLGSIHQRLCISHHASVIERQCPNAGTHTFLYQRMRNWSATKSWPTQMWPLACSLHRSTLDSSTIRSSHTDAASRACWEIPGSKPRMHCKLGQDQSCTTQSPYTNKYRDYSVSAGMQVCQRLPVAPHRACCTHVHICDACELALVGRGNSTWGACYGCCPWGGCGYLLRRRAKHSSASRLEPPGLHARGNCLQYLADLSYNCAASSLMP